MAQPNVFYFCHCSPSPRGGQKDTYRHVDILNRSGYQAFALHTETGFRFTWFKNQTRTIDFERFRRIYRAERDFIVLPENLGSKILDFPGKKVIFNKNIYYGFRAFGIGRPPVYPYLHADVVCVLTVSHHNTEHLKFAYPNVDIFRVYPGIDPGVFVYRKLAEKKRRIAFIPKSRNALCCLYHILESRSEIGLNKLRDYEWIMLANKSEEEVSRILQESLILVFLSTEEGLARTPLEAMSCGCLVVAHGSHPLKEYLPTEFQFERGSIIAMARYVEKITECFPDRVDDWQELAALGRQISLGYDQNEASSVLAAWKAIFQKHLT